MGYRAGASSRSAPVCVTWLTASLLPCVNACRSIPDYMIWCVCSARRSMLCRGMPWTMLHSCLHIAAGLEELPR